MRLTIWPELSFDGSGFFCTMLTSDFDYHLPECLIAQEPSPERTSARMLVLAGGGAIVHRRVSDLPSLLREGDLLVMNDTRVFPARVAGFWADTAGRVELLLVEPASGTGEWYVMARSARTVRAGLRMNLAEGLLQAEVLEKMETGQIRLRFRESEKLFEILEEYGVPPVPPYIRRSGQDGRVVMDRERYQTVYARERGAVAAPTAGLHFTPQLLQQLEEAGIRQTHITLHVGPGTFKPVKSELIADHIMEEERYSLPESAVHAIAETRAGGGRIVAVGSTTVRTLETVAARNDGRLAAAGGRSRLFIHPPYRFQVVDAMLTNFHLPRSTLLMMVCALAGRESTLAAYKEAVRERYRFYSYGDCMLVMPRW